MEVLSLLRSEKYRINWFKPCVFLLHRFYQIRTALRVSPKLPVKVEVNLPRNQRAYALFVIVKSGQYYCLGFHLFLEPEFQFSADVKQDCHDQ